MMMYRQTFRWCICDKWFGYGAIGKTSRERCGGLAANVVVLGRHGKRTWLGESCGKVYDVTFFPVC